MIRRVVFGYYLGVYTVSCTLATLTYTVSTGLYIIYVFSSSRSSAGSDVGDESSIPMCGTLIGVWRIAHMGGQRSQQEQKLRIFLVKFGTSETHLDDV